MKTMLRILCPFLFSVFCFVATEAGTVGINYGRVADNLPSAANAVKLIKSQGIGQVRLFDADPAVLRALAAAGIGVVVTMPNELLADAAAQPSAALDWIHTNVAAHYPSTAIHTVSVGNEVFADPHNLTAVLVPAMQNVHAALAHLGLDAPIKVSTSLALTALQSSYPPSAGVFRPDLAEPVMRPMLDLLRQTGSYLMVNAYPFFAYAANSDVISLDYALGRPNQGMVDSGNGLNYTSLFDAEVDAVFAAAAKLGYTDVRIVVTETGWPSKGDADEVGAGANNAASYNGNLVRRVLSAGGVGTPLRPQADVDVYIFALFNEDQKPGATSERNYGLFYPTEEKVYDIQLTKASGGGGGLERTLETSSSAAETWCVANATVGAERLGAATEFACGEGGADCSGIEAGAECYEPATVEAHASYAFNMYFQKEGRREGSCDFGGAAYAVTQPTRIGNCVLPSHA